jgi:putative aldouronate transport system substrate-binding protein
MIGGWVWWTGGNVIEAFIDPDVSDKERWVNTVIEREFTVPGYKEGLRFLNKMYNAGLVDKDFPLYDSYDIFTNLIKRGIVGSFSDDWDMIYHEPNGFLSDLKKNIPNADLIPVDCMTSSDGITHKMAYDVAGINFFIPVSSNNPEAAMRYLNWLAKYENYHFIQTGLEGITHTIIDGAVKIDASAKADPTWIQNSKWNIDYTPMMNGLFLGNDEENIRVLAAGYQWPANLIINAYNIAMTNAKPRIFIPTEIPLTVAGSFAQTLDYKGNSIYCTSIICSPDQFDIVYDTAVKDWLESGGHAIIDERRAKYVEP